MKKKQAKDKLKDYLIGGNNNLIDNVKGFTKRLILKNFKDWNFGKSDRKFLPEGFAILLYLFHRTGKIERFLYNPNLIFFGRRPLVIQKIIFNPKLQNM